jgi:hypothetical protein
VSHLFTQHTCALLIDHVTGHVGEPPAPRLQIWAQTTKVVWDQIVAMRPALPRGNDIPTEAKMYAKYVVRSTEGEEDQVWH